MPLSPLKKASQEPDEKSAEKKPAGLVKERGVGAVERSSIGAVELGKGFEEREAVSKKIEEEVARRKEREAREQARRQAQRKKAEERKKSKTPTQANPVEGLFSQTGWAKKKKYGPQYLKGYIKAMGRDFKKKPEYMSFAEKNKMLQEHLEGVGGRKFLHRKERASEIRRLEKELRKGSKTPRQKKDTRARIQAHKMDQLKKSA